MFENQSYDFPLRDFFSVGTKAISSRVQFFSPEGAIKISAGSKAATLNDPVKFVTDH